MAITKQDKQILQKAIQSIDVKKLYEPVAEEDKKKWFRFGAYDALRMVSEMIESYPESGDNVKHIGIKIANPDE
jgi:tRNA A37 methylthiotransferase MiaB